MFGLKTIHRPLVFAHRGASAVAVENSIPAFRAAFDVEADGIEFDVQLTRDGELIVFHDTNLDRLTQATGRVTDKTLREIQNLTLHNKFNTNRVSIPTLEEVLTIIPDEMIVNIEVKSQSLLDRQLIRKLANQLEQFPHPERVIVSSFNVLQLFKVKNWLPNFKIGLLCAPGLSPTLYQRLFFHSLGHFSIHPAHTDITPKLIRFCHQKTTPVITYTVNNSDEFSRLIHENIDGIFTDDPQIMIDTRTKVIANAT